MGSNGSGQWRMEKVTILVILTEIDKEKNVR
jgi:hypothetical protein